MQDSQLRFELLPSLGRGNELVRGSPGPEIVSQLIERAAEALRGSKALKPQHGIVALFDATMVLLDPIIFVAATPMLHLLPEQRGDRARLRVVPVGGDLFGTTSGDRLGTREEALGRRPVALGAQHRSHELPVPVDGTIQVALPSTYF